MFDFLYKRSVSCNALSHARLYLTKMANTFSQIYLHLYLPKNRRQSLEELHKYVTGLVQSRKAKMLAIHCMPDHIHIFTEFKSRFLIL